MGDSLHARGALPAHSETWFCFLLFCLLLISTKVGQSGFSKKKKLFAMDGRTRWQPEVREDAMHRFAF
jgi:hypothetical protein